MSWLRSRQCFLKWGRKDTNYKQKKKKKVAHSTLLAWETPWTEEPGRLQFMGSQRVRHDFKSQQPQQFIPQLSDKDSYPENVQSSHKPVKRQAVAKHPKNTSSNSSKEDIQMAKKQMQRYLTSLIIRQFTKSGV